MFLPKRAKIEPKKGFKKTSKKCCFYEYLHQKKTSKKSNQKTSIFLPKSSPPNQKPSKMRSDWIPFEHVKNMLFEQNRVPQKHKKNDIF
jgi:hypothetical protein